MPGLAYVQTAGVLFTYNFCMFLQKNVLLFTPSILTYSHKKGVTRVTQNDQIGTAGLLRLELY